MYLLVGRHVANARTTREFIAAFALDAAPPTAWFAATTLLIYLLGSLLVVRTSPLEKGVSRWLPWLTHKVDRLEQHREPDGHLSRLAWSTWHNHRRHRVQRMVSHLREVAWRHSHGYDPRDDSVHTWLHNEFSAMWSQGRVPVMRSYDGGCMAPSGFEAFYATDSVNRHPVHQDSASLRSSLADAFVREVKEEKAAIEVRIQMRFPEVYAEIDRLKVEAELRMSIFWPLATLFIILAFVWSPFALIGLLAPPLLLRDGHRRAREATERTWGALVAGEVSSPILDAMQNSLSRDFRNFAQRYSVPKASTTSHPATTDEP